MNEQEQYRSDLEAGEQFQDYVMDRLYEIGIPLLGYSSFKYQIEVGENKAGIEIKLDRSFCNTGNLYIEYLERSSVNHELKKGGVQRLDNAWLFLIGDYRTIFIFSKRQLKKLFDGGKVKTVKNKGHTSEGMLLDKSLIDRCYLKKIEVPEEIYKDFPNYE